MLNGIINYRFICAVAIIFFLLEVKYKFSVSCHVYAESAHHVWHIDLVFKLHSNVLFCCCCFFSELRAFLHGPSGGALAVLAILSPDQTFRPCFVLCFVLA